MLPRSSCLYRRMFYVLKLPIFILFRHRPHTIKIFSNLIILRATCIGHISLLSSLFISSEFYIDSRKKDKLQQLLLWSSLEFWKCNGRQQWNAACFFMRNVSYHNFMRTHKSFFLANRFEGSATCIPFAFFIY